jgi:hypothetical protein
MGLSFYYKKDQLFFENRQNLQIRMLLKAIFILPELCIYIYVPLQLAQQILRMLHMMAWHIISDIQIDSSHALRMKAWSNISDIQTDSSLRCA